MPQLARRASWVALLLFLAGCGEEVPPSPPAAAAEPAPAQVAAVGSAVRPELEAELAVLGLEALPLPAAASAAPAGGGRTRRQGPPAPPIAASPRRLDRGSPERLLASALSALEGGDLAALARLSRSAAERPTLDQDDALAAERRFLAPAVRAYWERIGAAAREGRLEVRLEGQRAVVTVPVGGAAGVYRVVLRREGDGWYLAS